MPKMKKRYRDDVIRITDSVEARCKQLREAIKDGKLKNSTTARRVIYNMMYDILDHLNEMVEQDREEERDEDDYDD